MFTHHSAAITPSKGDGGITPVAYTSGTLVRRYHTFTKFMFKKNKFKF